MERGLVFREVYDLVMTIPPGQVMSYGQIASELRASARTVGWAMAVLTEKDVPWHRVVAADGYLSIGRRSVELMQQQRHLLELEGVRFLSNGRVDMATQRYVP